MEKKKREEENAVWKEEGASGKQETILRQNVKAGLLRKNGPPQMAEEGNRRIEKENENGFKNDSPREEGTLYPGDDAGTSDDYSKRNYQCGRACG